MDDIQSSLDAYNSKKAGQKGKPTIAKELEDQYDLNLQLTRSLGSSESSLDKTNCLNGLVVNSNFTGSFAITAP